MASDRYVFVDGRCALFEFSDVSPLAFTRIAKQAKLLIDSMIRPRRGDKAMRVPRSPQISRPKWVPFALAQGVVSPLLFVVIVVVGGMMRPGYNHVSQAISELTEAGAADKPLLDIGLYVSEMMTIAFGVGFLWAVRAWGVSFRIAGALLVFIGVIGLLFAPFPMDPVGEPFTRTGTIHLIIAAVSSPSSMAVMIFAGFGWRGLSGGENWSVYSFITFAIVFVTGLLGAISIAQGWPTIGMWQRLSVGAFLLWKALIAIELMRRTRPNRGG